MKRLAENLPNDTCSAPMIGHFKKILCKLFDSGKRGAASCGVMPVIRFPVNSDTPVDVVEALNTAFLVTVAGEEHQDFDSATEYIHQTAGSGPWAETAVFYQRGRQMIYEEIESACSEFPDVSDRLKALHLRISDPDKCSDSLELTEAMWSFFFPEGSHVYGKEPESVEKLRARRKVRITVPNPSPLNDPAGQILFTSNVLLTVPKKNADMAGLPLSNHVKDRIALAGCEKQQYWYDHPIQIGVRPEQNEVLYGLRGLSDMMRFESDRSGRSQGRITCVLSVSVTHCGLQPVAKPYIEEEISRFSGISDMDIYVFTEADARLIIEDILAPAARHYRSYDDGEKRLNMFGVDGEYGRHYSFLKAISALWNVLIDPNIKATFKIDMDQVFPQKELLDQTGATALEHFKTPVWGASGLDADDNPVDLGMIAGALVNERDISKGIFTPDVTFPDRIHSPEDLFFFSALPQALSTEAEMMTRYRENDLDGIRSCIQRIHVTGGTNGILVNSLRRHRPFTPSFMGRAEDQAYIMSVLTHNSDEQLAYVHKDGLIMRHDKEAFAQDAIEAASTGKLVGDYVRILLFSEYARVLSPDLRVLKQLLDPFTGCFISAIPRTVSLLRFCLKAHSLFTHGRRELGYELLTMGIPRIQNTLDFVAGQESTLRKTYERERASWDLYYDLLAEIEKGLEKKDPFAVALQKKAKDIVDKCRVRRR